MNRSNKLFIILFSLTFMLCVFYLPVVIHVEAQGEDTNSLFVELTGQANSAALLQSAAVIQSRRIGVNPGALEKGRISLEISPGVRVTAIQNRREAMPDGDFIWTGVVEGELLSRVIFASRKGVLAGWISRPLKNELYELIPDSAGGYLLAQINEGGLPACGTRQPAATTEKLLDGVAVEGIATTGSPVAIDLLIAYTPASRNRYGAAGIESRIQAAVADANLGYINSGVNIRINLVAMKEVDYTESGSIGQALSRLTDPSDGYMDIIHTWRDNYGADLVALIGEDSDACGIGNLMASVNTGFAPWAFSVSYSSCLSNLTLAHEIGHNQGSQHNREDANGGQGAYPYSYGYRRCNPFSVTFRTIMSYDCGLVNVPRINYFSNPGVLYGDYPTGIAYETDPDDSADNARSLNETAATVAAFRAVVNANYAGYLDYAGCDVISGWAADRNQLNTPINVSIYDGSTLITTMLANQSRPDVGAAIGDNGLHGFNIPIPASLKDGVTHTISVKFETSDTNLGNSPKSITCSVAPNYVGFLDQADCDLIKGWAADRNRLNTSINVSVYDGSTLIATVTANQLRSDVGAFLGDNGLHGFSIPTPSSLKNGASHTVSVKFESGNTNLGNSPRSITCGSTPNYEGFVDYVGCDVIRGWAADRNRLNTSINVSVYDGSTLIATVPANQLRSDVGAYLGDNGLHGFNIATPASLKNGAPHTVTVKFEAGNTNLGNSPGSITCGGTPNYEGYVDQMDCNVIKGWAADRNRLNTSINVSIYDGATLLTTVAANQSRPDVGGHLGDNGLHGFNIATPASLKNGVAHSVSVKFETSGANLANSPRSLTCNTATPQITSISPASPPVVNGNQNVQVFGNNFQSGLTVDVFNSGGTKIGTLSGTQILSVTLTSFTMVINLGSSAGSFGIEVVNPNGSRSTRFTFSTVAPNPSVSSISPSSPPVFNGNQNVQVFGSNFQSGLTVDVFNSSGTKIGTLSGAQILGVTPTSFTMVINLGGSPGAFGIEVVNPNGGRSTRFTFSTR